MLLTGVGRDRWAHGKRGGKPFASMREEASCQSEPSHGSGLETVPSGGLHQADAFISTRNPPCRICMRLCVWTQVLGERLRLSLNAASGKSLSSLGDSLITGHTLLHFRLSATYYCLVNLLKLSLISFKERHHRTNWGELILISLK